jgi:hypothetical protein
MSQANTLKSELLESKQSAEDVEDTLWTDKYRPRHFTDLLGDEVSILIISTCADEGI